MKLKGTERKLIKYVRLYSELNTAKKAEAELNTALYGRSYFFAVVKKKNKLFLTDNAYSLIKKSGISFICLQAGDSLDFIRNEFLFKAPGSLIDFFKNEYNGIYFTRLKKIRRKWIKIPVNALKKSDIKENDFVSVHIFASGFIIKKISDSDFIFKHNFHLDI